MAGSKKTGRLIRYKRNEMGMTQDQLSKIINFTPAAISAWENGVRYPGPDAQLGLYNALGLNAVELLVGLEMFDEDLKKKIAAFMDRIDENVFVDGMVKDEDRPHPAFPVCGAYTGSDWTKARRRGQILLISL